MSVRLLNLFNLWISPFSIIMPKFCLPDIIFGQKSNCLKVKSTQYKKLSPNVFRFKCQSLKSCKSHEKNETKNLRPLVFSCSPIYVAFWYFLLCFFMWFARFQILLSEPQRIWHKLLVLSWLYKTDNKEVYFKARCAKKDDGWWYGSFSIKMANFW